MNIINRKIKEIFKSKSEFHRTLGLNPNNQKQNENSISKKIESIQRYINPLRLKLILIDQDLNLEKLEVEYSGDLTLDEIVESERSLMKELNLKKIELNYKGQKIILE